MILYLLITKQFLVASVQNYKKRISMESIKILALVLSVIFSSNALSKADSTEKVSGATTIDAVEAKNLWLSGAVLLAQEKALIGMQGACLAQSM